LLPAEQPGAQAVGPGAEPWEDEALVLLREHRDALQAAVVERGQHGAGERTAGGGRDVAVQQRGALRHAAQIAAARGAGEDGGETVVADLHQQLGELRCGREPRHVDAAEGRAAPGDGGTAAKDEPRAGPDPAAPRAGMEHEDRSSLVPDQAAGGNVRLVEETMVARGAEAPGLAAR